MAPVSPDLRTWGGEGSLHVAPKVGVLRVCHMASPVTAGLELAVDSFPRVGAT